MPAKQKSRKRTTQQKKRQGHHQRRSKKFHKTYLPYLPLVVAILLSILLSGARPGHGILAYATNTSINGLLLATNSQRANNGRNALTLNSQLSSAAQSKANDMVARDYWSHSTPDGQEPWVFIDTAGYQYLKAGENLAYGFLNSSDTITGWMNSPSHKANMLDSEFTEVGFGFANSEDFNNSGQQTVVVAMYGKPQTLAQSNQQQAPQPESEPQPPQVAQAQPTNQPPRTPVAQESGSPTKSHANDQSRKDNFTIPNSINMTGLQAVESRPVARIQTLANGNLAWAYVSVGIIVGVAVTVLLIKHAVGLKRLLKNSEQFIIHHPLLDSTLIGLIIIGITLVRTVGVIQ